MVRALLDGRKTQTRRVAKAFQGRPELDEILRRFPQQHGCPYGAPGDRLWAREAWAKVPATAYRMSEGVQQTVNPADPDIAAIYAAGWDRSIPKWKPSIHMPRWASRITLEITEVRVERLQDISEADAIAEGSQEPSLVALIGACWSERDAYAKLWEHINGPGSWDANPWVWAVSFEVAKP